MFDHISEPAYAKMKLSNTNEWSPLQKNDPLKEFVINDYIPPVLQNVKYWADKTQETGAVVKKPPPFHTKYDHRPQTYPQMHYYVCKFQH